MAQDSLAIRLVKMNLRWAGLLFRAVAEVGCLPSFLVVAKRVRHPQWNLPRIPWIKTRALSNLKTHTSSGSFHALRFTKKYAEFALGAFSYRFNRRSNLAAMTERVVHALCSCQARRTTLRLCGVCYLIEVRKALWPQIVHQPVE